MFHDLMSEQASVAHDPMLADDQERSAFAIA
jgi:hypothetical protein